MTRPGGVLGILLGLSLLAPFVAVANSTDIAAVDDRGPSTSNGTQFQSKCDATKLACVAKRQACLLKVHASAEKKGAAPDAAALERCADTLEPCLEKLERKQDPTKPKTLCSRIGDLVGLTLMGDAFVTNVVTAVDPSFPAVGPPSVCDGGKKVCALKLVACQLKVLAAATKKGGLADGEDVEACRAKFHGGAKGFAKGCVGKLQTKQNVDKPKTLCSVVDDGTALEALVDTFVDETYQAVLDLQLD